MLVFEDGEALVRPSQSEIAARIGLRTAAELPFYDLVILGGGPAGLAAAVYGASEGLRTLLVERHATGGQAGQSSRIENYLGFPAGVSGADLARRATIQAQRLGAEMLTAREVLAIRENGPSRVVTLDGGAEIGCHSVLIATGVHYSRLEAPGVEALTGSGVYYGASPAEAAAVEGEDVVVVGAANSAGQAAVDLATRARRVVMLCRADGLEKSMSHYLIERIRSLANVEVTPHAVVTAAAGDGRLEELTVAVAGREERLSVTAAFVFIGARPQTDWLGDAVARDAGGFIVSGARGAADRGAPPLAAGARSLPPRDQPAGRLRGRGRPRPIDQARGVGGRRGLDGGAARAPVPRRDAQRRRRDDRRPPARDPDPGGPRRRGGRAARRGRARAPPLGGRVPLLRGRARDRTSTSCSRASWRRPGRSPASRS